MQSVANKTSVSLYPQHFEMLGLLEVVWRLRGRSQVIQRVVEDSYADVDEATLEQARAFLKDSEKKCCALLMK